MPTKNSSYNPYYHNKSGVLIVDDPSFITCITPSDGIELQGRGGVMEKLTR
jgi:hypothetical protein